MKISVARPSELGPAEAQAWTALQHAADDTWDPFFSLGWARLIDGIRADARVAVIEDAGRIVAFLPVQRPSFIAAMPLGAPLCDNFGLIRDPAAEIDLRAVARALKVDRIDFALTPESQTAFAPYARTAQVCTGADVSLGWCAYVAERKAAGSDAIRNTLRKQRKLERERGEVTVDARSRDPRDLEKLIDWKIAQLVATRQPPLFRNRWVGDVLRAAFETDEPDFGVTLTMVRVAGQAVGAVMCLRGAKMLHGWWISHDADPALLPYSPGLIAWHHMVEHAANAGYARVDFGEGDYQYKRTYATYQRSMQVGVVARATPAAMVREAAYSARSLIERAPWPAIADLPGKAMRRIDYYRALAAPLRA